MIIFKLGQVTGAGVGFLYLPMGNILCTRQLSPGSYLCTNTTQLPLSYLTVCLSVLPAGGWTISECCRLSGFALQIEPESCEEEMGARPLDLIYSITS